MEQAKDYLPTEVYDFLIEGDLKIYFNNSLPSYIKFRAIDEIQLIHWNGLVLLDLLKEVDRHDAYGVLTWSINDKTFATLDTENNALGIIEDMEWEDFVNNPTNIITNILDGEYGEFPESDDQSILLYTNNLFSRIQSSDAMTLKLDFAYPNYVLYKEELGQVTFRILYYCHKEGASRSITGEFSAKLPHLAYIGVLGDVICKLKKNELTIPERFITRLKREYQVLLQDEKYRYLFEHSL